MASLRQHGNHWQVRVRRKGYPEQVRGFVSKADAMRWARQAETEMDRRVFIPRAQAERTTVADLIERYEREVTPLHRGGDIETIRLDRMLRHQIASYPIAGITPELIAGYRNERLEAVTPGTVLRELQILSAVFNHARKEWSIAIENPVAAIRKPSPNRARNRRLELEEEKRLLEALEPEPRDARGRYKGGRNTWIKPLVQIALETAMRRGELLALRWEHVYLDRRVIFLPETKNGHPRYVPLSSAAMRFLETLPRSIDGRVFPVTANALNLSFKRAVRRAGLGDFHFHDLRHEATSRLAERLPNVIELASVTGHRDVRMLARYYHPRAEHLALKLG